MMEYFESSCREVVWADSGDLLNEFTSAMSAMYRREVPQYGDLIDIVSQVNAGFNNDTDTEAVRSKDAYQPRVEVERHGAIRLASSQELNVIRRMFAILGLYPVDYYDLTEAGLPMHATSFRPITSRALSKNPFRVFTSVLRPELIRDHRVRNLAEDLVSRRNILSNGLSHLLDIAACQSGRLTKGQSEVFITEAIKVFQWQGRAMATKQEYDCLLNEHPVIADICCFGNPHINHLTPRTLDITVAQELMEIRGLSCKEHIEGPPQRACPILLRQTSFLAIEESIEFCAQMNTPRSHSPCVRSAQSPNGLHRARFGEIEERGAALTPKGRELYDTLLRKFNSVKRTQDHVQEGEESQVSARHSQDRQLAAVFSQFPDDWSTLRKEDLVYFTYRRTDSDLKTRSDSPLSDNGESEKSSQQERGSALLEDLIGEKVVEAVPITYEDFLPLSAAGIFKSNIGPSANEALITGNPDFEGMEAAMGTRILNSDCLYSSMQKRSIQNCAIELGVEIVTT